MSRDGRLASVAILVPDGARGAGDGAAVFRPFAIRRRLVRLGVGWAGVHFDNLPPGLASRTKGVALQYRIRRKA